MTSDHSWTRLRVEATGTEAELLADALWTAGCAGIEERDEGDEVVLLAGFETGADAAAAQAILTERGHPPGRLEPVADDGLDGWRRWATPERAGPFVVCPAWVDPPPIGAAEHLLLIDPARSFGSGSHPTTRLVLAALADVVRPGDAVLDVGCGSGVLAIGAALLGAGSVVGVDVDARAPEVTVANARRNGVAEQVTASTRPLAEVPVPPRGYDLVVANLLSPVIVELAADLVRVTGSGGLIVSGLLPDRWRDAADALAPLAVHEVRDAEGWVALVLHR